MSWKSVYLSYQKKGILVVQVESVHIIFAKVDSLARSFETIQWGHIVRGYRLLLDTTLFESPPQSALRFKSKSQ